MKVSPFFEKYRGPGGPDWMVAIACSVLIAAEVQTSASRQQIQSGVSYYFDSPWVPQIHTLALVVDGSILGLAVLWMVPRLARIAERAMVGVAALGLLLCWLEIVYALRLQTGTVYTLPDMPFQPVNNVGVVGAQVFGSYLILKSPAGHLKGWRSWAVKLALVVAFWFFQFMIWQMVSAR